MSGHQNPPPKRPRLSLQIKAISSGPNLQASRTIAAVVNPTSPTSFNTLSNVYATAIDRSTPVTAINTKQPLKLHTQNLTRFPNGGLSSFVTGPDTPLTAQPISPAAATLQDVCFPSAMTATPPMSAGPVDAIQHKAFTFQAADVSAPVAVADATSSVTISTPPPAITEEACAASLRTQARRNTVPLTISKPNAHLPYVRNRSLHSILRNSPLPPPTARTPISPRRASQRLAERAARRVCYESPIEHIITTNEYVTSHIDLLLASSSSSSSAAEDAMSPTLSENTSSTATESPTTASQGSPGDERTRDGGMTPGPFEEMRRRMAGLGARTPTSPVATARSPTGVRKKKNRREKARRWVWTIGNEEEGPEDEVGGAIAAWRAAGGRAQSEPRSAVASAVVPSVSTTTAGRGAVGRAAPIPPRLVTSLATPVVVHSPMDIATPSIETLYDDTETGVVALEADGQTDGEMADVTMSDSEVQSSSAMVEVDARRAISLTPSEMEFEVLTPVGIPGLMIPEDGRQHHYGFGNGNSGNERRLGSDVAKLHIMHGIRADSEGAFTPVTRTRQDTPVPAAMAVTTE